MLHGIDLGFAELRNVRNMYTLAPIIKFNGLAFLHERVEFHIAR